MKGELAQYREMQAFSQFASDLDKSTRDQLSRGQRLVELLKQSQYAPFAVEKQVISIYTATNGYMDDVAVEDIRRFETELLAFIDDKYPDVPQQIRLSKELKDETTDALKSAIGAFKSQFKASR